MGLPETGSDTIIFKVPEQFVAPRPDSPLPGPEGSLMLLEQLKFMIEDGNCSPYIRMANFWVTRDPEVVAQRGLAHDCATCRAGVDQAVATMREHPETVMAVGLLSYYQ